MKNHPAQKQSLPLFASVAAIVFLLYGLLLQKHYAIDTYVVEAYGDLWIRHIAIGRFVSAAILKLCATLGINTAVEQSYFTFIAICLLSYATYLLITLFSSLPHRRGGNTFVFLSLACLSATCNLFTLHWFLFPEVAFIMVLGLLLTVVALFCLLHTGWKSWAASYLLVFLALSCYQAVGPYFVIFGLLCFLCKNPEKTVSTGVKEYGKVFIIYALAAVTNIMFTRLSGISDERTAFGQTDMLQNIPLIFTNLTEKLQITGLGHTPLWLFILFIGVLIFTALFVLRKEFSSKEFSTTVLHLLFFLCCSVVVTMSPHLLTSTVDISPRSIASLLSLPGALSLFLFFWFKLYEKPRILNLFQGILILFFLINAVGILQVERSRLATNRMDRQIAEEIAEAVSLYEQENQTEVTRIALRHDSSPTLCYPEQICYGNFRAMGRKISALSLLKTVTGKDYRRVFMPAETYTQFFKGKEWDSFSKDQLKIQNNTLYLMLY